jgi:hypothetical protein
MVRIFTGFLVLTSLAIFAIAQTPDIPADARGVIRLRVRVKVGNSTKGLSRKRFFLVKGSLEQNKELINTISRRPVVTRDCYYRGAGGSEQLINWLRDNDCESVYCREIEDKDLEGAAAPPEFLTALAAGEKEYGSRQLARKWLAVSLPESLRDGFYKNRRSEIDASIKQAEATSGAKVLSVMTDRNGTAYFTDLQPGAYTLTNIVPVELEAGTAIWNCEMQVKPGDLATEKPFLISNRKDKNVKCVAVETPVPVCDVQKRSDR